MIVQDYYAFISYKREDAKWATWLQNKIESYKLPTNINGKTDLPSFARPVFKDTSDLASGVLVEEIQSALERSKYLIIICTKNASKSTWIDKEARYFIDSGRADKIIPFIVDGEPNSDNIETECFPQALRDLPEEKELLGISIKEMGKEAAVVKVIAQMFGLPFDTLWQREEKRKTRITRLWLAGSVAIVIIGFIIGLLFHNQNQERLRNQSRYVSKQAEEFVAHGYLRLAKILTAEVLPKNVSKPSRPITSEAEKVLRMASSRSKKDICYFEEGIHCFCPSPDKRTIAIGLENGEIVLWDSVSDKEVNRLPGQGNNVNTISFSYDGKRLAASYSDVNVVLWDLETQTSSILERCFSSRGLDSYVGKVKFNPSDLTLVSYTESLPTVTIWDTNNKTVIDSISITPISKHPNYSWSWQPGSRSCTAKEVTFSKDGSYLAVISEEPFGIAESVRVFNYHKSVEEQRRLLSDSNTHMTFNPSGECLTLWNNGKIEIWNWKRNQIIKSFHTDGFVRSMSYLPNDNNILMVCKMEGIDFFDISNVGKEPDTKMMGATIGFEEAVFLNEKDIISNNFDGKSIIIQSLYGGDMNLTTPNKTGFLDNVSLSFSENDQSLIIECADTVLKWNCIGGFEEAVSPISIKAFVSDEVVRVTDGDGVVSCTLSEKELGHIPSNASISSEGTFLLSISEGNTSNDVVIYDLKRERVKNTCHIPSKSFTFTSISESGDYFIIGQPFMFGVYCTESGNEVFHYSHLNDIILGGAHFHAAAFSHSGTMIAAYYSSSYMANDCIIFIDFPHLQDLIDDAQALAKSRPLTNEEKDYLLSVE